MRVIDAATIRGVLPKTASTDAWEASDDAEGGR